MKTTKQTYNAKRYLLIILVTLIFVASLIYILASPTAPASAAEIPTQYQYTITYISGSWSLSSGNTLKYSVHNGNNTVIATEQNMPTCIEAIRVNTGGNDCTIIFNLGNSFDSTTCTVTLSGSWGNVTLQGRISSSVSSESTPTFGLLTIDGVSVISEATIQNTCNTNTKGIAVFLKNGGSLLVNSGTISGGLGKAIYNNSIGTVNITGGNVSSKVTNNSTGQIIVGSDVINSIGTYSLYPVTFEPNGGTITGGNATQSVIEGGSAVAPTVTRTDYTLTGWDKDYTNITAKVITTAQWMATEYIPITLKNHDGFVLYSVGVFLGNSYTIPEYNGGSMAPPGKVFTCWKNDLTGEEYYTGQSFAFTETITATAQFEDWTQPTTTYTVTFDLAGGTLISGNLVQTVKYGNDAVQPIVEREDYSFMGWSGNWRNITSNCTITAQWQAKEPTKYTVTFEPNGGGWVSGGALTQSVIKGQDAELPILSKIGHEFTGWLGTYTNITSDCTVTAQWTKIIVYVTVTFDLNGGELVSGELIQKIPVGSSSIEPIVKRDGYLFKGWFGNYLEVASNCNVIAQWQFINTDPELTYYTVTFHLNGGTLVSGDLVQSVVSGGSAIPPVVKLDGYTLESWVGNYQNVTSNCGAIAAWVQNIPNSCIVTFDLAGGIRYWEWQDSISVSLGTNLNTLPYMLDKFYKDNCVFLGWTVKDTTEIINVDTYIINSSVTLVAQWTSAPVVTIRNNLNDEIVLLYVTVRDRIYFESYFDLLVKAKDFYILFKDIDYSQISNYRIKPDSTPRDCIISFKDFYAYINTNANTSYYKDVFGFKSIPNSHTVSSVATNLEFGFTYILPGWSSDLQIQLIYFDTIGISEPYEITVNYDTISNVQKQVEEERKEQPKSETAWDKIVNWIKSVFPNTTKFINNLFNKEFNFWPWQWDGDTAWYSYVVFILAVVAVLCILFFILKLII